jgi:phage terminase large subunit-like protein
MALPQLLAPPSAGRWFPPEQDLAIADRLAALPPDVREQALESDDGEFDTEELLYDFRFWGRPSQLHAYDSDAHITAILAGRGAGKTRTISEIAHKLAKAYPGSRGALVARTTNDVRQTMVKGDSGILNTCHPNERPKYVPNNREVTWPNGTVAHTFTASVPDMLRGPQFDWAIADEGAAWPHRPPAGSIANAWDNLKLATRLGDHPQIFMATTPRRVPMVIEILNGTHLDPSKYNVIRGSTAANRHLAQIYHETIVAMYEGTSLAKQELEGELLGDIEGALLKMAQIRRVPERDSFQPLTMPTRIIGVDPSVAEKPRDECGIVVVCATAERNPNLRKAFVVADESVHGSPGVWAKRVATLARQYRAYVVAEDNQGGELVRMIIKAEDPEVPVVLARSAESKQVRAEPVVLAYERGKVSHLDYFGEYESQLTSWVPDESNYSPDRLDAGVIGLSAALINPPSGMGGRIRLGRAAGAPLRRMTSIRTADRSMTGSNATTNAFKPQVRFAFRKESKAQRRARQLARKAEEQRRRQRDTSVPS